METPEHFTRLNYFQYGCNDCKHKNGRRCGLHKIQIYADSFCKDNDIYQWTKSPEHAELDNDSTLEQIKTARRVYEARIAGEVKDA